MLVSLTLFDMAFLNFSQSVNLMNSSFAFFFASRFLLTISEEVSLFRPGSLLLKISGIAGFFPKTSWFGEKPPKL